MLHFVGVLALHWLPVRKLAAVWSCELGWRIVEVCGPAQSEHVLSSVAVVAVVADVAGLCHGPADLVIVPAWFARLAGVGLVHVRAVQR